MPILTAVGALQETIDLALQRYTIEPITAKVEELRRDHDMAINLERIGHCLLRVRDVERSKRFYMDILGFQLMEQDPEHGGVFMSLPGDGHTIDMSPVEQPEIALPVTGSRDQLGLVHIAFKVGSYTALQEAYKTLQAHGIEVHRLIDHGSQRSLYFNDPDGNGLEIYYEYPNARELFLQGRGDQDRPFTFDDPLPEKAATKGVH